MDFPIGNSKYLPPEVVVAGPKGGYANSDDVDLGGSFEADHIGADGMRLDYVIYITGINKRLMKRKKSANVVSPRIFVYYLQTKT